MSERLGSRGGSVHSLQDAQRLQEAAKPDWSERIRESILRTLRAKGEWHADDLFADLPEMPVEHANCIGAQVGALVKQGVMREIDRRKATNPASHGRRSSVYALTDMRELMELSNRRIAGASGKAGTQVASTRAADSGEAKAPERTEAGPAGDGRDDAPAGQPALFEVPKPERPGYMDPDQEAA